MMKTAENCETYYHHGGIIGNKGNLSKSLERCVLKKTSLGEVGPRTS